MTDWTPKRVVVLAEPEQYDVHDLVGLVVDERFPGDLPDRIAEVVVAVVVVPDLLNDPAGLQAEPGRHVRHPALTVRVVRGRAHVSSSVVPACPGVGFSSGSPS